MRRKLLVIAGPTAVGKTDYSIETALRCGSPVISCDSRQIYKEMTIGTAKITYDEMKGVKHHLLDIVEPGEDYSVGNFESDVRKILKEKWLQQQK